jgi:pimeloyl-ACP methyl ester carboxylesterase
MRGCAVVRLPILFVPGFTGSFNLRVLLDWREPTLSGWNFPPFTDYGRGMLRTIARAGYRRNRDFFVAFYDWRKSVQDNVQTYLIPWIDRALDRNDQRRVILVCHSMGGLLARSYIQGRDYRDDVDRVLTLGTPHRGAANSYYAWGGGEIPADPLVRGVLNVYLWYLQNANPTAGELNRLMTMRSQVPGIRDLLPIDDYLVRQDSNALVPEATMQLRNYWGNMLNNPSGLDTLFERTDVTTIVGSGFDTIQRFAVRDSNSAEALRYPDGEPTAEQADKSGDGTVPLANARLDDRADNRPPVNVAHGELADQPAALSQVLEVLELAGEPVAVSHPERLVVMTASPIEMTIEPEEPAVGMLGRAADRPTRRSRTRTFQLGHRGKPLTMTVMDNPRRGNYRLRLHGIGTGSYAVGALAMGAATFVPPDTDPAAGAQARGPAMSTTTTCKGMIAAETDLFYRLSYQGDTEPPDVRFDRESTARDVVARLRAATRPAEPGVLGAPAAMPPIDAVMSDRPPELRGRMDAALRRDDRGMQEEIIAQLAGREEQAAVAEALCDVAGRVLGTQNELLANGLLQQIAEIMAQGRQADA